MSFSTGSSGEASSPTSRSLISAMKRAIGPPGTSFALRARVRTRRRLHKFLPVVDAAPLRCVRIQTPAESRYDSRPEALRAPTKRPWGGALPDLVLRSQGSEHASDRAPFHSSDSLSENLSYSASRASSACRLWHAHPQERGVER